MSTSLRFMSFNLRTWTDGDGPLAFPHRADRIRSVILSHSPDVIGFQEMTPSMKDMLRRLLPEYTLVGCGRDESYGNESMTIALKNEKMELISLEQFWLSPTPSIPGTRFPGDQSACPRMALSALVVSRSCSIPVRICNVHLDHVGKQARYLAMMQIIQYLSLRHEPTVLLGDMNALPDSPEIKLISEIDFPLFLRDCTETLGGTFHNYGRLAEPIKIDYIFTDLLCDHAMIVPEPDETSYYSDHFALIADLDPLSVRR